MSTDSSRNGSNYLLFTATCLFCGVCLLFVPLGLSFLEFWINGGRSHIVEETCRRLGIFDFLSAIYLPVLKLIRP